MTKSKLMNPAEILPEFDEFLHLREAEFEAIIIGAGALSVLGVIPRQTRDFDILSPEIPALIQKLANEFRIIKNKEGIELEENWLNNGPSSICDILEKGWRERLISLYEGKALTLQTLGRVDFIGTKLDAMCQRGDDFKDLIRMKPTQEELTQAIKWVKKQDANPGWPDFVDKQAQKVAKGLGYEL